VLLAEKWYLFSVFSQPHQRRAYATVFSV